MNVQSKVFIVTGGGNGIGRELVLLLLKKGARVIGVSGKPFTENNIGHVLATRDLLADLRSAGSG